MYCDLYKIAVPSNYDIIWSVVQMASELLFDWKYWMKEYVWNIFESALPTQLNIAKPVDSSVGYH